MKANVLIDSHGWIEYFSGGPNASKYAGYIEAANVYRYVTPSIVLYEVYKKIKSVAGETPALEAVAHIIEHTSIIPIDKKISLSAAEISLKNKLAMADAMIKAVADFLEAKIITGDPHFKGLHDVVFIE